MCREMPYLLWRRVCRVSVQACAGQREQRGEYGYSRRTLLVPQNYGEVEKLVNKVTIEDFRALCYPFGLLQDEMKASLKGRLFELYNQRTI